MASEWVIPGQGFVMRGHVESLREARDAAAQWMRENGFSRFEAESETELANVQLAWWDEDAQMFAQPDHSTTEAVTVVNIPV